MKRQAGFTIVELVVVIALLGILAAVALPRFVSVTGDAKKAAVEGVAGSLKSGIAMVKAQAIAQDKKGQDITLDDGTTVITTNSNGFPSADGADDATDCTTLFTELLQGTSPIAEYTVTAPSNTCVYTYKSDTSLIITYTPGTGSISIAGV